MWLSPQGQASLTDDSGTRFQDTSTCAHCNRITHIRAKMRPEDIGGLCKLCMGLICPTCIGKACMPFMEKVDRLEKAIEKGREVGRWWECA